MDYIAIINIILGYGSIILGVLFALTTMVNLVVEVVKRLMPKVPTDLVVFIVSIALTVLALYVYAAIMGVSVMWYYAIGAVVLGIFVAYAAMFGFDKFTALWQRVFDKFKA